MGKIILIGGPPRSGKTTLAQKISEETGISWVSSDALDDIAKRYVPESDLERLFPKTTLRIKSGGENDGMYVAFSIEEIVSAYIKQAETIHKAIESFILCANVEDWNYVIEGYHVTPKLIAKLRSENIDTSSVMLISTKAEEVIERSIKSDTKQDWLRDNTKNQETFQKIADMISLFSKKLKQEAEENGIKVIDTSENFETKFQEAFDYLIK
ncbi:MAG: hypothetical protein V4449_02700 [Patescibacteria group bacterium]